MSAYWPFAGWALLLGGIAVLRSAWRGRGGAHAGLMLLAWAMLIGAPFAFALRDADRGVAIALIGFGAVGYLAVASSLERRSARRAPPNSDALDPAPRPARIGRALWRFIAAGPLSGLAALALVTAFALRTTMADADRMALAAITQPLLWGALMAWAMADARLVRVTAAMSLLTLAASACALWPHELMR